MVVVNVVDQNLGKGDRVTRGSQCYHEPEATVFGVFLAKTGLSATGESGPSVAPSLKYNLARLTDAAQVPGRPFAIPNCPAVTSLVST